MSTPAPSRSSLLEATQQKLDELDALIERMLTLPVVEVNEDMLAAAGLRSDAAVNDTDVPPTETATIEFPHKAIVDDHPRASPIPQADTALAAEGAPAVEEITGRETRIILQLPFLAINRLFDFITLPLGPAGRWLRGEQGRALLGFTGLALLTAAAVLGVLDWILNTW